MSDAARCMRRLTLQGVRVVLLLAPKFPDSPAWSDDAHTRARVHHADWRTDSRLRILPNAAATAAAVGTGARVVDLFAISEAAGHATGDAAHYG
eukprot:gene6177-36002_t